jgi:Tfp pilus assembly protein PilF
MIIAILFASFLVYFNSLYDGFVYDDEFQVVQNHWIRNIKYIPEIFSESVWKFQGIEGTNYYRPLLHLVYMINYHIFGLRPWSFHLVNVLFHASVSVLVFIIASRLLPEFQIPSSRSHLSLSFMAAVFFATHPIHTEAVTWIAGLPDLSFTFFCLLSFYLYVRSREVSKTGHLFSAASFFLATLCKETALTFPLILVAYDYVFKMPGDRPLEQLKRYVPFFAAGVVYFLLRLHALGGFAPQKEHMELSTYQYGINVFPLFAQYLWKILLPINLNAHYVLHPVSSIFEIKSILALIVTVGFFTLTFINLKKNKATFFSLLFVIPLLPVFYIPGLGENTFTERYLYLPSVGFVVLLALFIAWIEVKISKSPVSIPILFLAIIGLYSYGTIDRNPVWRDNYSLFSDTVKKSPDGAKPRNNLGYVLETRGQLDEAIEQYQIALKLRPDYAEASNNLGSAYDKKGWIDKAMEQYQATLMMHPYFTKSRINLGYVFEEKGLLDEAIKQYQVALKLNPESVDAFYSLGNAFFKKGWTDRAIEQYQIALKLNPDYADVHFNLGIAFQNKGLIDEAIGQFQIALALNPSDPAFRDQLARAYEMKSKADKDKQVR